MATQAILLSLPYISLQPSISQVISDITHPSSQIGAEDCWISCYRSAGPSKEDESESVHGKIRISQADEDSNEDIEIQARGEIQLEMINQSQFRASCETLSIPQTTLHLPSPLHNAPSTSRSLSSTSEDTPAPCFLTIQTRGGIDHFVLSSDGRRIAIGSKDGQCRVVEIVRFEEQDGKTRLRKGKETALRGHVGDITRVEFFPSNEVVLTASSDMSLRVFSAIDGSNPRHLQGHTKRVTGLHILTSQDGQHKGREILSSSLDGTLKLWDVSTGPNTRTWRLSKPISSLLVMIEEGEAVTSNVLDGKFAMCGHADGEISILSLASSTGELEISSSSPLTTLKTASTSSIESIAFQPKKRLVAVGARNGIVTLFKLPSSPLSQISQVELAPIVSWRRTEGSSINSLKWSQKGGGYSLLVASSDGLPYRASVTIEEGGEVEVRVVEEFVGLDCDACTCIDEDGEGRVWTSGGTGDGSIRVYE
ncbi:hypothetical protein JCM5353_002328 [Sporobolomyces roseus]